MRAYFDRKGRFRGYSMGIGWVLAGFVVIGILAMTVAWKLILLSPFLAFFAFAGWLVRDEIRRQRRRRAERAAAKTA